MFETNYNPDVLTCLANLSNDEVFTPPNMANEMLDLLPEEIWRDKNATFLDPVSKSGVFLREIAKRLMVGLETEIPDQQERINHIFKNQLYGIAITQLTSLLSRRSVYCSKIANGEYSICEDFDDEQGNVLFKRIEHTWKSGKCQYCGASQEVYDRDDVLETHAYQFIHTENPEEVFDMRFDVIVGNPPYQLGDGGFGASAAPIYHKFVQQAKKLNPRYLTMIVPSRWFTGGRVGDLSTFRDEMLNDDRVRIIHDFVKASDCFPGVEVKGGVSYFLWDRDNRGLCKVYSHEGDDITSMSERPLLEEGLDTFIRTNEAISILRRVSKQNEDSFDCLVSANDPFGFDVRVKNSMKRVKPQYKLKAFNDSVYFYYNGWKKSGLGHIDAKFIKKNREWVNTFKIFVPKAVGSGDTRADIIKPFVPEMNSCSSETYIVIGPFKTKAEMENVLSYIKTKFFHFMVGLKKNTQECRRNVYELVPMQDFAESWTDEKLYKKYKLTEDEIAFIESMIRPMEI
jgi:site-specific DNA-methyltransferase (adenine-specific)